MGEERADGAFLAAGLRVLGGLALLGGFSISDIGYISTRAVTLIVCPRPPGKDLQQFVVACMVRSVLQGMDIWCVQQLGEDKGVGHGGGLLDQIGCGAR